MEGSTVRLEPLGARHREGLLEAAQSPDIWTYLPERLSSADDIGRHLRRADRGRRKGTDYFFAVKERAAGRLVGSTAYLDVSNEHRGVEIGWTWYVPDVWGTRVNPECKYLLLSHAFEEWGAIRVFLKTDSRNLHSQAAIRKLGAVYEGTLRNHRILPDGYRRASAYFSILDAEWPAVKARLEERLSRP